MSQTVSRLKELLFDNEAQALADLATRLDQIALTHNTSTSELRQTLDAVFARVGNAEHMTDSIVEVIDEALRRAEVSKHSELSLSIAPLVVTTIKAELKNSQDEMVEALYPITGRLVKSYVASAIKDLAEDMNRRLERNPIMLRLESLTTGRSVGELALASTQDFHVLELFLIRRGSGELVAHWPQEASSREQLMSGVLAAVNAFANEALSADEASLRQIDLGEATVYLRGSQLYLLAAKCSGTAPKDIEQTLDDAFLTTIEKKLDPARIPLDGKAGAGERKLIADLATDVTERIEQAKTHRRRPGLRPLKILTVLILLPLLAWAGWSYYLDFANERVRSVAANIIASTTAMHGYPAHIEASHAGRDLRVSGLAPSQSVKDDIVKRIGLALPKSALRNELAVVPGSDIAIPDTEPKFDEVRRAVRDLQGEMERSAITRVSTRAAQRLEQAAADVKKAAKAPAAPGDATDKGGKAARLADSIAVIAKDLDRLAADVGTSPGDEASSATIVENLDDLNKRLAKANAAAAELSGAAVDSAPLRASNSVWLAIETLAASAERQAALASVIATASSLRPVQIIKPAAPEARQLLETFVARNAIFFSNSTDYRSGEQTRRTLDALVPLIRDANTLVRVVGYTDDAGTVTGNQSLGQLRADKVRDELLKRGVPANLVVAIGRRDLFDLSTARGADSPNRRVTFETGYDGEAAK